MNAATPLPWRSRSRIARDSPRGAARRRSATVGVGRATWRTHGPSGEFSPSDGGDLRGLRGVAVVGLVGDDDAVAAGAVLGDPQREVVGLRAGAGEHRVARADFAAERCRAARRRTAGSRRAGSACACTASPICSATAATTRGCAWPTETTLLYGVEVLVAVGVPEAGARAAHDVHRRRCRRADRQGRAARCGPRTSSRVARVESFGVRRDRTRCSSGRALASWRHLSQEPRELRPAGLGVAQDVRAVVRHLLRAVERDQRAGDHAAHHEPGQQLELERLQVGDAAGSRAARRARRPAGRRAGSRGSWFSSAVETSIAIAVCTVSPKSMTPVTNVSATS